jgi:hypothetical protein
MAPSLTGEIASEDESVEQPVLELAVDDPNEIISCMAARNPSAARDYP